MGQSKEKLKQLIFNNICLHNITRREALQNHFNFVAKIHHKFQQIKQTHQVYQNVQKAQNNMCKVISTIRQIEIANFDKIDFVNRINQKTKINHLSKTNHIDKINKASKINHIDKINHRS
jgi:hypothetical protein